MRRPLVSVLPPVGLALVVGVSLLIRAYGCPIDDAYIFFVYARNLATSNGLGFNAGELSFGTSGILWTALLALEYRLGLDLVVSSRATGALAFALTGGFIALAARDLVGSRLAGVIAGLLAAVSPPLYQNATTGMDTALHTLLVAVFLWALVRVRSVPPWGLGLAAGLLVLSRPDGLIAVPAMVLGLALRHIKRVGRRSGGRDAGPPAESGTADSGDAPTGPPVRARSLVWDTGWMLGVFLLVIGWWELVLLLKTGSLLPTTYYGRMAFGIANAGNMMANRLVYGGVYFAQSMGWLLGPSTLGVPAVLAFLLPVELARRQAGIASSHEAASPRQEVAGTLFCWLMAFGLVAEYAIANPWERGGYGSRYIAPSVVPLIVACSAGLHYLFRALGLYETLERTRGLIRRPSPSAQALASLASAAVVLVGVVSAGYYQGRQAVAHWRGLPQQVALQEVYRRGVAEWIAANTDPSAKVADYELGIGTLGYYSGRYIIDLGGALIHPDLAKSYLADGTPSLARALEYFRAKGGDWLILPEVQDPLVASSFTFAARFHAPDALMAQPEWWYRAAVFRFTGKGAAQGQSQGAALQSGRGEAGSP